MAKPVFWIKLAAAANPFDATPTWTDITSYVRTVNWQRGRGSSLDEIGPGTGSLILKNTDRRFEPGYAGPYDPLRAYRPINVGCTWSAVDYSLFYAFIESYRVHYDTSFGSAYAETEVTLVDAIALFNTARMQQPLSQQLSSSRINAVLTASENAFPAAMRDITASSGTSVLAGPTPTGEVGPNGQILTNPSAWESIQNAVRSHAADLPAFVDRRGYVVYKAPVASGLTFGDSGSELDYTASGLDYGISLVYNAIDVTREGGVKQSSVDTTSVTRYRRRSYSRSTFNVTDAAAALVRDYILTTYKEPRARLEGFTVRPGSDSAQWDAVITLDLEHTITVRRRPPGGGTMFSQTPKIVGLNWQLEPAAQAATIGYTLTGSVF